MQPIVTSSLGVSGPPLTVRKRGLWLGSIIATGMVGNVFGSAYFLLSATSLAVAARASDGLDPTADFAARSTRHKMLFLALLGVCDAGMLAGAWAWKKWGVYGHGLLVVLGILVTAGIAPLSLAWSAVSGCVAAALFASKWRYFE